MKSPKRRGVRERSRQVLENAEMLKKVGKDDKSWGRARGRNSDAGYEKDLWQIVPGHESYFREYHELTEKEKRKHKQLRIGSGFTAKPEFSWWKKNMTK
jgi:hypothetical protein